MKPNGGKFLSDFQIIFDYQLSCYWRVTENAFGIWSGRFGGFSNQANLSPEKAGIIVLVSFFSTTQYCTNQVKTFLHTSWV